MVLKKFSIHDGAFEWMDETVQPLAHTTARIRGDITAASWGGPAAPAILSFNMKIDGIADEVRIDGTAAATPTSGGVKLEVSAAGLKPGMLVSYLPPGVAI